jgi:hypothetical protein
MNFDLRYVPFSRYGSYFAFSRLERTPQRPAGLCLRALHGDGLADCGQAAVAKDLAGRFCRLCAKAGFAENFDALTGQPLCDRAYTWTASVFFVLAHEYLMKR